MFLGVLLLLSVVVNGIRCSGAGPPGGSPHRFQSHGGVPGQIGQPGSRFIYPVNTDIGRLIKVDDPVEANKEHVFSDPMGPVAMVDENGNYIPLRPSFSNIRSKSTPQIHDDDVREEDWETLNADNSRETSRNEPQTGTETRSRANTLYNMFRRGNQPSPGGHLPGPLLRQPGPQGPPRLE